MTDDGPTDADPDGIDVIERATEGIESDEYGFALEATATLDGPEGRVLVRRRYEALPYHNDDLYPEGADSNDGRTDRPDEVQVHTRFYAFPEDAADDDPDYVGDAHESWTPEPANALADEDELAALCATHHLADPVALYRDATERR